MTRSPLKHAVRADHDGARPAYEVYDTTTGATVKRFPYKHGEKARGVAHGRANLARRVLNDLQRKAETTP